MNVIKVPISDVQPWDKNPRGIKTKDFERLKKQIADLGEYKPLVAFKKNGKYVVLGGNMRLKAYQDMGVKEVSISIVDAPTTAKQIKFALSDNDRAGYYEEDKLAELVYPHIADLDLSEFKVDLGEAIDLKQVVEGAGPNLNNDEKELDELETEHECPKCGYKW